MLLGYVFNMFVKLSNTRIQTRIVLKGESFGLQVTTTKMERIQREIKTKKIFIQSNKEKQPIDGKKTPYARFSLAREEFDLVACLIFKPIANSNSLDLISFLRLAVPSLLDGIDCF